MTLGGNTPYGPGGELPPSAQYAPGQFPAPPSGPAGSWQQQPVAPPVPKAGGGLIKAGIATALAMSTAALVVGGIALTRHTGATNSGSASSDAADTSAADKALCTAIAPILADSDQVVNAWINAGPDGSPARDAALQTFKMQNADWTKRAQEVLDANPSAGAFFQRTLQRYIDDHRLLALALRPGELKPNMEAIYTDGLAAYAGPLAICGGMGITW